MTVGDDQNFIAYANEETVLILLLMDDRRRLAAAALELIMDRES